MKLFVLASIICTAFAVSSSFQGVQLNFLNWPLLNNQGVSEEVMKKWSTETGGNVTQYLPTKPNDNGDYINFVQNALASSSGFYDVVTFPAVQDWMFSVENNRILDLTNYIRDPIMDWPNVLPTYQKYSTYDGHVYAIPDDGDVIVMFYRRDIISAGDVPQTWDDLLVQLARLNGTDLNFDGKPDYSPLCMIADVGAPVQFEAILGSLLVTDDTGYEGSMFDLDRNNKSPLSWLMETEGFQAAMKLMQRFAPYAKAPYTQGAQHGRFASGGCAFYVSLPSTMTLAASKNTFLWGKVGTAPIPGSPIIYHRASRSMKPCTKQICPYMTSNGLNRPSYIFGGLLLGIPRGCKNPDAAFSFIAYMSRYADVRRASQPLNPFRRQHFNVSWFVEFGYNETDITLFLNADYGSLSLDIHAHLTTILPFPLLPTMITTLLLNVIQYQNMSVSEGAKAMRAAADESVSQSKYSILDLDSMMRKFHNLFPLKPDALDSSTGVPEYVIAVIVVLVVGVFVALFGMMYQYRRVRINTRDVSNAPRGESCALMFTDIQNSTKLWNTNSAAMEKAVAIHHLTVRKVINHFKAYEVKTIGDSFMIATDSADKATRIACMIQENLIHADWPAELLKQDDACEVPGLYRGVRVRIGIHYGRVDSVWDSVAKGFDYYGDTVNIAARVESVAQGGQTILSARARHELSDDVLREVEITDLGEVSLKGVEREQRIFQVMPPSLTGREFRGSTTIASPLSPDLSRPEDIKALVNADPSKMTTTEMVHTILRFQAFTKSNVKFDDLQVQDMH